MSKKQQIESLAARHEKTILDVSARIWEFAEPGMKEYKSADCYAQVLRDNGFAVETGVSGIPTAVIGTWGSGRPVIGFLGEFDALPGLSQKAACPEHCELVPGAYGQGCGHNNLGAGALGAAFILRDYLKETGKSGTVRFYGCPGEEYGSGKVFMARDGLFNDLDACLTWHPGDNNHVVGTGSLANISAFFIFHGRTAHAAATPHLGRSALDACELMSVGVNYMREHMPSEARIHYAYKNAGGIAPNVVQDYACVHYFVRAPKIKDAQALYERVKKVAQGAALMTETELEVQFHEALCDFLPNRTLDAVCQKAFEEIGAPPFDDQDEKLAARFRSTFSQEDIESVGKDIAAMGGDSALIPESETLHRSVLPYFPLDKCMGGSTDVGDASYCAPTSQLNIATCALGTPGHSWQLTAQSNSPLAEKGTMTAAKVLALAAAELLDQPETLAAARRELNVKTGGAYHCPIPPEVGPTL